MKLTEKGKYFDSKKNHTTYTPNDEGLVLSPNFFTEIKFETKNKTF